MENKYQDLYTGERYLAHGAFGVVHLVNKKDDDSKKYVSKKIDLNRINLEQAMIEVNLLKNLNNPYIVKFEQCFHEEDFLIIVLEFCGDGDLSQLIKKHYKEKTRFKEADIMAFCVQMSFALQYIHSKRIIHRDMKPQNILINGQDYKLADFGISVEKDLAMTQIGTAPYASPEVYNKQPYGPKTDVWGLGCILYELCTLQRPFKGATENALAIAIIKQEPDKIEGYSNDLIDLIQKLLKKDQRLRPSINEILQIPYVRKFITENAQQAEEIKEDLDQEFDELDLSDHVYNSEFPHRQKCQMQEKCQFWNQINNLNHIDDEEKQLILIHLLQFDHKEVKCPDFNNCKEHKEYLNNLNCSINIQLHEAFFQHPPVQYKLIIQNQEDFDAFKNKERMKQLTPVNFSTDICKFFIFDMSNYDSDQRFDKCFKHFDKEKPEYDSLNFLSLLKEELELSQICEINFNQLEAIAYEKFNHKRHYEMRSPCTIPELIAIMLSLQDPFFKKIQEIDMKFKDPNVSDNVSEQYQTFRDTFYENHELPVMKYLCLSGLLKIAMSDPQKKPSNLFLPFSSMQLDNLQIAEQYDFFLESLSICTDDKRVAIQQLGQKQKGTILEIDVTGIKIQNEDKELPLTFFVASVDWLMRNYKDRQFIIFGELGWTVNQDPQSEQNQNGIKFYQVSNLTVE